MFVFASVIFVYAACMTYLYAKKISKQYVKPETSTKSVEALKNALLTLALMKLRHDDIDDMNMLYSTFDGSRLPMLSGCSVENACFSYIISKEDFKNGPFYTKIMHDKLIAIDKYLEKNLGTMSSAVEFFEEYLEFISSNDESDKESEKHTESSIESEKEEQDDDIEVIKPDDIKKQE